MAAFTMVTEPYVDRAWRDRALRTQFEKETGAEPIATDERALEEQLSEGYYTFYRERFVNWLSK